MKKTLAIILVLCLMISGAALAESASDVQYTYNRAVQDFPTNWSPHNNQTTTDSEEILQWVTSALFDFDFNETMDGFVVYPLAAADFPVDVTADYVGEQWGIAEGAANRAWKFTLREGMMWQDGTPITAADYVTSAKFNLNPIANNHRADTMYNGSMVIYNAEGYAKQGTTADTSFGSYMDIVGAADVDALLSEHGSEAGYIDWANSYGNTYDFEAQAWTGAAEAAVVDTGLTVAELYEFFTTGIGAEYASKWAEPAQLLKWAMEELFVQYTYPEMDFSKVGVQAVSDNEFVLILKKPLEGFYLYYSLTDTWLVNEALYTACETITDGVYNNTYGTSAETTISFGPYMLESFQSDKAFVLVKNPNWFGYSMEENEGLYQTTRLSVACVKEPATRHEMFLNGQLDIFGLDKDYIGIYGASDYTYYSEGPSTFAMVFNPNLEAQTANQEAVGANINKTIITLKEFRMAMAFGINRADFCAAASPMNAPAYAIYSGQIVADPDNGIFYRTTDIAKQVVVNFWGLADEIGEGKLYATIDDAIDSITGYNLEMAKEYFDLAYDKAIAEGLMKDTDIVEIMIGTSGMTSAFQNSGYEFIVNNYTEAVKGTKLEGKLTFKRDGTLGNGFADALRDNTVDMLFGVGWNGSTFDPYGLMEAYTSDTYRYDAAWDTKSATMDIEIDGVTYTATVWDWTISISGEKITATVTGTDETAILSFPYSTDAAEAATRLYVLACLENEILQNYNFIPLMGNSSAALKGMKVEYFTEDEVFPMGRGGVKYMTYNYDDAAWDAYVTSMGGTLNYK